MSYSEENYLKALYSIGSAHEQNEVGTNDLASHLQVKPASVSEMLKKLKTKDWVDYKRYGKIKLTPEGWKKAVEIVRKHRLWETFLYDKLNFDWDEIHEIAEELEHIGNTKLTERLDKFLGFPKFDPHGDPIPDSAGRLYTQSKSLIATINIGKKAKIVGVKDSSAELLQYANALGLNMNTEITVIKRIPYDGQTYISIGGKEVSISEKVAENIIVVCEDCVAGIPGQCCYQEENEDSLK